MKERRTGCWKKTAVCVLAAAFLLTACGGTSKSSGARQDSYEAAYDTEADGAVYNSPAEEEYKSYDLDEDADSDSDYLAVEAEAAPSGTEAGADSTGTEQVDLKSSNRKIVYTGNISLQTLEYEKSSQGIHDKISSYGGFIESEDTYNEDPYWYYSDRSGKNRTRRNLNITARIPAEKFNSFMKDLENDGQVTNTSVNARNISVQYATHDASKKALEIEQKRLLEMMEKAETVEDMIAVEQRLTQVERELNDEKTQLSAMDRDVGFSTVYIRLEEVFEYTEQVVEVTYWERLQKAFGRAIDNFIEFWGDLILFIAETFPFLIMLGIVIVLIRRFLRRRRARRMKVPAASVAAQKQEKRGFFGRRRRGAPEASGNRNINGTNSFNQANNGAGGADNPGAQLSSAAGGANNPGAQPSSAAGGVTDAQRDTGAENGTITKPDKEGGN